jgi:hypothetical protein
MTVPAMESAERIRKRNITNFREVKKFQIACVKLMRFVFADFSGDTEILSYRNKKALHR